LLSFFNGGDGLSADEAHGFSIAMNLQNALGIAVHQLTKEQALSF
jgi:hypothetical protein